MLSVPMLVQLLIAFAAIGALPLCFFRRGRFNLRWLATAIPFFVTPILLTAAAIGELSRWALPAAASGLVDALATLCASAAIVIISMTVTVHRVPLSLWHQDDDAPSEIVIRGPYRYVRHPFYTGFLLALLAAFLAWPQPLTLLLLLYGFAALAITAAREERRLSQSELGEAYRRYAHGTGRFLPRIGA